MRSLEKEDSDFLSIVRASLIVVMVFCHVSGMWFWRPYSEFLAVVVPVFFFMSGAVSYPSFKRSQSTYAYLEKRVLQLLTPYYCMCVVCLAVYVVLNRSMPAFSMPNLLRWITITPRQEIMPFPVIQVWFLHCSIVLSLLSPAIFRSYERRRSSIWVFISIALSASCVQLWYDLGAGLDFSGHNLFRPVAYSLIFCLGVVCFQTDLMKGKAVAWIVVVTSVGASIGIVRIAGIDPDYAFHMANPDIYFILGCICFISLLLIFKKIIVVAANRMPGSKIAVNFLVQQTFAIFLLHTLATFIVEKLTGLGTGQRMTIPEGLAKFTIVLSVTLVLAVPFTRISKKVEETFIGWRLSRRAVGL